MTYMEELHDDKREFQKEDYKDFEIYVYVEKGRVSNMGRKVTVEVMRNSLQVHGIRKYSFVKGKKKLFGGRTNPTYRQVEKTAEKLVEEVKEEIDQRIVERVYEEHKDKIDLFTEGEKNDNNRK